MGFLSKLFVSYNNIVEKFGFTESQAEYLDKLDGKKDGKYQEQSLFDVINQYKEEYDNYPIKLSGTFYDYAVAKSGGVVGETGTETETEETASNENKKREVRNIALDLAKQIFKPGFANLDEPISKINSDNVLEVLETYKNFSDKFNLYLDNETLFEAILDESISDDKKRKYINHIKEALVERAGSVSGDTTEIAQKFSQAIDKALDKFWPFQSSEVLDKLFDSFVEIIDQMEQLKSANNKSNRQASGSIQQFNAILEEYGLNNDDLLGNGYFDNSSIQVGGHCWIHAGINNMMQSPKGKQYINNLIYKNPNNGSITVYLPGAKEKGFPKPAGDGMYTFSERDLAQNIKHSSLGDGDYTAFVLAIQQFRREFSCNIDNGGGFEEFCEIIYGSGQETTVLNTDIDANFVSAIKIVNAAHQKVIDTLENGLTSRSISDEDKERYRQGIEKRTRQIKYNNIQICEDPMSKYQQIRELFMDNNCIIHADVIEGKQCANGKYDDNTDFETLDGHAYTILKMNENNVVLEESNHPGKRITYSVEDFMSTFVISLFNLP